MAPNIDKLIASDKVTRAFDIREQQKDAMKKDTADGVVKSSLSRVHEKF